MTTPSVPTRRSFISVAGAALSAPLAAAAVAVPAMAVADDDPLKARLALLEDLNAIRALNHAHAKSLNMTPGGFEADDVIEIAADRQTATSRLTRVVHTEIAIGPDCPLVDMARQQGGGVIHESQACIVENDYVRQDGIWRIRQTTHRPA